MDLERLRLDGTRRPGGHRELRREHGFAGGTIVLFGGLDSNSNLLSDTWTWKGTAWMQLGVTGPSARYGAALAAERRARAVFGGADYTTGSHSDAWTWNGTTWNQLSVGKGDPAQAPEQWRPWTGRSCCTAARESTAVARNSPLSIWNGTQWAEGQRARSLRDGPGGDGPAARQGRPLRRILGEPRSARRSSWVWDGTAWAPSNVAGPPARAESVMATAGDTVVLFGGEAQKRRCPALGHLD